MIRTIVKKDKFVSNSSTGMQSALDGHITNHYFERRCYRCCLLNSLAPRLERPTFQPAELSNEADEKTPADESISGCLLF